MNRGAAADEVFRHAAVLDRRHRVDVTRQHVLDVGFPDWKEAPEHRATVRLIFFHSDQFYETGFLVFEEDLASWGVDRGVVVDSQFPPRKNVVVRADKRSQVLPIKSAISVECVACNSFHLESLPFRIRNVLLTCA